MIGVLLTLSVNDEVSQSVSRHRYVEGGRILPLPVSGGLSYMVSCCFKEVFLHQRVGLLLLPERQNLSGAPVSGPLKGMLREVTFWE
jgi:hypothetical protein